MSVPADVYGVEEWEVADDVGDSAIAEHHVPTADDSEIVNVHVQLGLGLHLDLPTSPLNADAILGSGAGQASATRPDSPLGSLYGEGDAGRTLRSRWSASTLSSPIEESRNPSARILRFQFGGQKKGRVKRSASPAPPLPARGMERNAHRTIWSDEPVLGDPLDRKI